MLCCDHKTLGLLAGHTPTSSKGFLLRPLLERHHDKVGKDLQEVFRTFALHHQQRPYIGIMLVLEAVISLLLR